MVKTLSEMLRPRGRDAIKVDAAAGAGLFAFVLIVFLASPVRHVMDSNYSMLLSQSLLHHRSFTLDGFSLPRHEPKPRRSRISVGDIHQLEYVGGHIYYLYPPGSSVLSLPFVALMNAAGISAANADGSHNLGGETRIQAALAALLMALLALVFYFTGRVLLPPGWSALLALGAAFGTQVWSTASRGVWSDTWGIFLLGLVTFMLVAREAGLYPIRPILLATLLAWTYFMKPTYSIPVVAVTAYMLLYQRRLFLAYAAAGAAWLAAFLAYSWYHFRQPLPNYYIFYNLFETGTLTTALPGNLVSPSRGLLVFVPALLFVAYLLVRYRADIEMPRLAVLSLAVVATHLFAISLLRPWHGGHSYGPRLSTGIVPWFFLAALLSVRAWRRGKAAGRQTVRPALRRRLEATLGGALLLVSITMNGVGATSYAALKWNECPVDVTWQPDRVWDWRHPQFLAPWDR